MTDEEINRLIAEACGWTDLAIHPEFGLMGTPPDSHGLRTAVDWYTVDLNAMHEAEQAILGRDWNLRYDYIDALSRAENPSIYNRLDAVDMLDLTARQRAEALLKTIGKWEEGS
jgi:hypothetical protein